MRKYLLPFLSLYLGCATADGTPAPSGTVPPDALLSYDAGVHPSVSDAMDDIPPVPITPDAGSPPDASEPVCSEVQVVNNGFFDQGNTGGWVTLGEYQIINANDSAVTPQYLAWFGGVADYQDALYQDVAIPTGTTRLRLNAYVFVATTETDVGAYDSFAVEIGDTANNLLESVTYFTDDTNTPYWMEFTNMLSGNYSGQIIRLFFSSQNDALYATSFYLDNVDLFAVVCN